MHRGARQSHFSDQGKSRLLRIKKGGPSSNDLIEPNMSLEKLKIAAQLCRGCDIWRHATQAFFA